MHPKKKYLVDYLFPVAGIVFVLFLCIHIAVVYEYVTAIDDQRFDYVYFFQALLSRIESNPADFEYVSSTLTFLGAGIGVCLLAWAYTSSTKKKLITGKEYGTADWGKPQSLTYLASVNQVKQAIKNVRKKKMPRKQKKRQIELTKKQYKDADILLTRTEKVSMLNYELNSNTLIIGGSGSGKTRGFVMPNILQAHSSYIITDPKGEIFHKAAYFLKEVKAYKIRVLNLDKMTMSDGYNPFYYIHIDRDGWEERVLTLIETIIVNTDGGEKKGSSDPFWDKAERIFLQAIFFAVLQDFPPMDQNMNTVLKLIGDLQLEDENDSKESALDKYFVEFKDKYTAEHIAVQQFREFRDKASGKTAKSIVISASARLAPFRIKEVRRIFSYDNLKLDRIGEEKTAIFVIVPPTNKTFNFIAGMLFVQIFQELNYCALEVHKHNGQRLPIPCRFILDEFANTCTIPNFVQILAYARSLGIGITTILQSLEQIKKMYKDEWGVIIDNCSTLLYLGSVAHMETLEYISKLLGKGTFDKKDNSRTRGRQSSSSISNSKIGRELLTPDEIRNLKKTVCLLIVSGKQPFYSQKLNLKLHKNYKYTPDKDPSYTIDYKPQAPPDKPKKLSNKDVRLAIDRMPTEQQPIQEAQPEVKDSNDSGFDYKTVLTGIQPQADKPESMLDGLYEELTKKNVTVNLDQSTVAKAIQALQQASVVSFDDNLYDDDMEVDTEDIAITTIKEEIHEVGEQIDNFHDVVEVATDLKSVAETLERFAEGEEIGVPTIFADGFLLDDEEWEIDENDVLEFLEQHEDYDSNISSGDFARQLNNVSNSKLTDRRGYIDAV